MQAHADAVGRCPKHGGHIGNALSAKIHATEDVGIPGAQRRQQPKTATADRLAQMRRQHHLRIMCWVSRQPGARPALRVRMAGVVDGGMADDPFKPDYRALAAAQTASLFERFQASLLEDVFGVGGPQPGSERGRETPPTRKNRLQYRWGQ